ncbi:MAG: HD domain-containing protein [Bacteroidetes bacterium]|nr:HD domain-containing protein [Bacteroidota bacterium]MDA1118899.1 HD domain-containing protein [Bacteroidota bacterium]
MDYFSIIHKYIPPNSPVYPYYIVHVTLVTAKALKIADHMGFSNEQKQFVEEAAMLHDIGIIRVNAADINCRGSLPYVMHIKEGKKILEAEGLASHARIAENHFGIGGITKDEIEESGLKLPLEDIVCKQIEDKVISYSDLFFSKNPSKIFNESSVREVREKIKNYGSRQQQIFELWHHEFVG